jgi:hypothetical protein
MALFTMTVDVCYCAMYRPTSHKMRQLLAADAQSATRHKENISSLMLNLYLVKSNSHPNVLHEFGNVILTMLTSTADLLVKTYCHYRLKSFQEYIYCQLKDLNRPKGHLS